MDDALERYVTYLIAERNVSPYTLRNYRTEIGQFIEYRAVPRRQDVGSGR